MKAIAYLFRKLQRDKLPNYLGIAGLATGLVCVLYIFLWVHNEISYDRFHKNSNEIFVVHAILEGGDEPFVFRGAPPAVAPTTSVRPSPLSGRPPLPLNPPFLFSSPF